MGDAFHPESSFRFLEREGVGELHKRLCRREWVKRPMISRFRLWNEGPGPDFLSSHYYYAS